MSKFKNWKKVFDDGKPIMKKDSTIYDRVVWNHIKKNQEIVIGNQTGWWVLITPFKLHYYPNIFRAYKDVRTIMRIYPEDIPKSYDDYDLSGV